jgi:hypothetical protein
MMMVEAREEKEEMIALLTYCKVILSLFCLLVGLIVNVLRARASRDLSLPSDSTLPMIYGCQYQGVWS